jgi:hypothetical protein
LVGVPAGALAQEAAPPAPVQAQPAPIAVEPAPAPAPAPEPTFAPAPEPEAPAATEETEPAPADGAPVTGWFRIDSDFGGVQLWGGATFPLSDTIGLATDIYVYGSSGEFDIGPSITLAPGISILPMIGLQIDWFDQRAEYLVPQFYAYVDSSLIYFEFWSQFFLGDMFVEGTEDYVHLRAFPLFKASDVIAIGLEIDANISLGNVPDYDGDMEEDALQWLPIGPHVKMAAGAASTIELFVGYDLADPGKFGDRAFAGRFTFTQTF